MSESIDNKVDFEDIARLSLWLGFQYFKTMDEELRKETDRCSKECQSLAAIARSDQITSEAYSELGFWYRNLARSFMSYVDGILYVMRRLIIFAQERSEVELSPGEAVLVREKVFTINVRKKRIEERDAHNRLLENFFLTFSIFPRVFGSEFKVDYGHHGWEKFQDLVDMRNSLSHPKSVDDTLLRSKLPNTVRDALVWFYTNMGDFFKSVDLARLEEDRRRTLQSDEIMQQIRRLRGQGVTEQSSQAEG
jgi:hypothetical protein